MSGFAFPANRAIDLLCLGRAGVDFYAQQEHTSLEHVATFRKSIGGSPANIATGVARLGGRAGVIGAVSNDGFGRYVQQFLRDNQVDIAGVKVVQNGALNSIAFTEMQPEDCSVIIYRKDAADLQLQPSDIAADLLASSRALLVTGTALSASPSREATLHAMDLARRAGTVVVLDLDYRPYGWVDTAQAAVYLRVACTMADIIIGNREEFDVLEFLEPAKPRDDHASARNVLHGVTQAAVVKDGKNGCRVFHQDGSHWQQSVFAVQARKPFGSGDAFAATLLWALLGGQTWPAAIRLGAAAAAMIVSRDGCAEAMVTYPELTAFLAQYPS